MRVLIVGAGEVGFQLASHLAPEGHDIVVLDRDPSALARVADRLDVQTVVGSGSHPGELAEAGVAGADLLAAVTDSDEVNAVACALAAQVGRSGAVRVARIRCESLAQEAERLGGVGLGVHRAINPELLCAEHILRLLDLSVASDHLSFEGGRVLALGLRLSPSSEFVGRRVADLAAFTLLGDGVLLGAIFREGRVIIPSGSTAVEAGAVVYAVARPDALQALVRSMGLLPRPLRSVVIAGGGRVARYVAAALEQRPVHCKLICADERECRALAELYPTTVILHGKATDRSLLAEERVERADVFVAAGAADEDNTLAALTARQLGVPRTFVVTTRSEYIPLLRTMGVDVVVAPRLAAVSSILTYIRRGRVLQVASLGEAAEAIELEVPADAPATGTTLAELPLPEEALVVSLTRDGQVRVPGGTDQLRAGDHLVVFALRSAISDLERLFRSASGDEPG